MHIIAATSGDSEINAIFTSTSAAGVPVGQRSGLLGLLPQLLGSVCVAGAASSNARYQCSSLSMSLKS